MRYHLTAVRMTIIKNKSIGKNMEKLEPLCPIGVNVKWCNPYGKQYGGSSKKLAVLPHDLAISFWVYTQNN